ncbi:MAG: cation diffusion facilitator family transporter [Bacteroidales bacterium]|nr:cation diffusion facilitator family transporter [Bacteroidales bacterium]
MSHNHTHDHLHDHSDVKNIKVAFFLNFGFTLFEIAGGFLTNSIAILSDAVHDLGDSLSLGLAWYFQKVARKGSDTSYSYGYKRFSLLGAVINSIVLIVGSIFILTAAVPRIFNPQHTQAEGMFLLAIVGILVNGAAVFRLKKGDSLNEKVVSLHLLEDVLGWAAILVGSIVMYFFDVPVLDPIMSIAIACFVLFNVYKNIRQSLRIILQGIPDEVDITDISTHLSQFKEIESIHDVHIWSVDGNYNVMTVHVVLKQVLDMDHLAMLKATIRESLETEGIQHVTIEFETANESCNFEKCC